MQRERQRDARDALDAQINTLTQQMAWTSTPVLRQALANAAPGSASSIALQRAIGMRVDGEPQPAAQQPTPAQAAGLRTAAEGGGTLQAAAADYLNRSAPPAPATPQPVQRGLPQLPAAPAPQRTPEVFAGNAPAAGQGTASLPAVDNSAAGRAARDALPITSAQDAEGARAFSAAQQTPDGVRELQKALMAGGFAPEAATQLAFTPWQQIPADVRGAVYQMLASGGLVRAQANQAGLDVRAASLWAGMSRAQRAEVLAAAGIDGAERLAGRAYNTLPQAARAAMRAAAQQQAMQGQGAGERTRAQLATTAPVAAAAAPESAAPQQADTGTDAAPLPAYEAGEGGNAAEEKQKKAPAKGGVVEKVRAAAAELVRRSIPGMRRKRDGTQEAETHTQLPQDAAEQGAIVDLTGVAHVPGDPKVSAPSLWGQGVRAPLDGRKQFTPEQRIKSNQQQAFLPDTPDRRQHTSLATGELQRSIFERARELRAELAKGKKPKVKNNKGAYLYWLAELPQQEWQAMQARINAGEPALPYSLATMMPAFKGNKREMLSHIDDLVRRTMTQAEIDGVLSIDDWFGGGGAYSTALANTVFKNVREIRINEYAPVRRQRIQYMLEHGADFARDFVTRAEGEVASANEILNALLETEVGKGNEKQKTSVLNSFSWLKDLIGGFFDAEGKDGRAATLEDRLAALGDVARQRLEAVRLGGKPLSSLLLNEDGTATRAGVLLYFLGEQSAGVRMTFKSKNNPNKADHTPVTHTLPDGTTITMHPVAWAGAAAMWDAHASANMFRARGGSYAFMGTPGRTSDSYALVNTAAKEGKSALSLADPPYFATSGYKDGYIWGADDYARTRDLLQTLAAKGNNIIYTDEAWWHGKRELSAKELSRGASILADIRATLSDLFTAPTKIGQRYEQLGIHTPRRAAHHSGIRQRPEHAGNHEANAGGGGARNGNADGQRRARPTADTTRQSGAAVSEGAVAGGTGRVGGQGDRRPAAGVTSSASGTQAAYSTVNEAQAAQTWRGISAAQRAQWLGLAGAWDDGRLAARAWGVLPADVRAALHQTLAERVQQLRRRQAIGRNAPVAPQTTEAAPVVAGAYPALGGAYAAQRAAQQPDAPMQNAASNTAPQLGFDAGVNERAEAARAAEQAKADAARQAAEERAQRREQRAQGVKHEKTPLLPAPQQEPATLPQQVQQETPEQPKKKPARKKPAAPAKKGEPWTEKDVAQKRRAITASEKLRDAFLHLNNMARQAFLGNDTSYSEAEWQAVPDEKRQALTACQFPVGSDGAEAEIMLRSYLEAASTLAPDYGFSNATGARRVAVTRNNQGVINGRLELRHEKMGMDVVVDFRGEGEKFVPEGAFYFQFDDGHTAHQAMTWQMVVRFFEEYQQLPGNFMAALTEAAEKNLAAHVATNWRFRPFAQTLWLSQASDAQQERERLLLEAGIAENERQARDITETAWEHLPPSWRAAFGRAYAKQPGKWKGTRIKRDTDGWQQSDTTTNTTTNAGNESGRGEDAGGEKVQAVRQALNNYLSAEEVESLPLSKIFPRGMVEAFEDLEVAALLETFRAALPRRKQGQWVAKVQHLQKRAADVAWGIETAEKMHRILTSAGIGDKELSDKARLLEQLPREHWRRIGVVYASHTHTPIYAPHDAGARIPDGMAVVEVDGKFVNFPKEGLAAAVNRTLAAVQQKKPRKKATRTEDAWRFQTSQVQPDDESARILQGAPVAQVRRADKLNGNKLEVASAAAEIFKQQGGKATRADIGDVTLDKNSAESSAFHGELTEVRRATFGAIQSVIERGALIAHAWHGNFESFYISAPITIDGVENIMTVTLRHSRSKHSLYIHAVMLKENLLPGESSAAADASGRSGTEEAAGGFASVPEGIKNGKYERAEIRQRLRELLTMEVTSAEQTKTEADTQDAAPAALSDDEAAQVWAELDGEQRRALGAGLPGVGGMFMQIFTRSTWHGLDEATKVKGQPANDAMRQRLRQRMAERGLTLDAVRAQKKAAAAAAEQRKLQGLRDAIALRQRLLQAVQEKLESAKAPQVKQWAQALLGARGKKVFVAKARNVSALLGEAQALDAKGRQQLSSVAVELGVQVLPDDVQALDRLTAAAPQDVQAAQQAAPAAEQKKPAPREKAGIEDFGEAPTPPPAQRAEQRAKVRDAGDGLRTLVRYERAVREWLNRAGTHLRSLVTAIAGAGRLSNDARPTARKRQDIATLLDAFYADPVGVGAKLRYEWTDKAGRTQHSSVGLADEARRVIGLLPAGAAEHARQQLHFNDATQQDAIKKTRSYLQRVQALLEGAGFAPEGEMALHTASATDAGDGVLTLRPAGKPGSGIPAEKAAFQLTLAMRHTATGEVARVSVRVPTAGTQFHDASAEITAEVQGADRQRLRGDASAGNVAALATDALQERLSNPDIRYSRRGQDGGTTTQQKKEPTPKKKAAPESGEATPAELTAPRPGWTQRTQEAFEGRTQEANERNGRSPMTPEERLPLAQLLEQAAIAGEEGEQARVEWLARRVAIAGMNEDAWQQARSRAQRELDGASDAARARLTELDAQREEMLAIQRERFAQAQQAKWTPDVERRVIEAWPFDGRDAERRAENVAALAAAGFSAAQAQLLSGRLLEKSPAQQRERAYRAMLRAGLMARVSETKGESAAEKHERLRGRLRDEWSDGGHANYLIEGDAELESIASLVGEERETGATSSALDMRLTHLSRQEATSKRGYRAVRAVLGAYLEAQDVPAAKRKEILARLDAARETHMQGARFRRPGQTGETRRAARTAPRAASTAKGAAEAAERLQRALTRGVGEAVDVRAVQPSAVQQAAAALASRLFGRQVVFFESNHAAAPEGAFLIGRTLYVNADAASPVQVVMGHELWHSIASEDPQLVRQVEAALRAIGVRHFGGYARTLGWAYTRDGLGKLDGRLVREEFTADVFGHILADPQTLRELAARTQPNTFRRVVLKAWAFLNRLLRRAKADAFLSGHIADIEAARQVVLDALEVTAGKSGNVSQEQLGAAALRMDGGDGLRYQRRGQDAGLHAQARALAEARGHDATDAKAVAQAKQDIEAAQQEFSETEKAYGGKAAYDAAKKAGKTRLTYQQWVQVRTPSFKKWFGDWEAVRGVQALQRQAPLDLGAAPAAPSALVSEAEAKARAKERRKAIENALRGIGNSTNDTDGLQVRFPASMGGKISRHQGFDVQSIVGEFGRLFRGAVPMFSEPEQVREGHKEHVNFLGYRHYVNRFRQGGKDYYVRFTVQQTARARGKAGEAQMHSSFVSAVDIYNEKGAGLTHASFWDTPILTEAGHLANRNVAQQGGTINQETPSDTKLADWLAAGERGASAVVDERGEPLVMFHQTGEDFTVFDVRRLGAGSSDPQTPFGVFMKPHDGDIGLRGKRQMALFANIKNPLRVHDRADLDRHLRENVPDYGRLMDEMDGMNAGYNTRLESLADDAAQDALLDEWDKKERALAARIKKLVDGYFHESGFDGIVLTEDEGGFGKQTTQSVVALKPAQVKSATGNIGTFDAANPDIRFSRREQGDTANTARTEPLTRAQRSTVNRVQMMANKVIRAWKNAPKVQVVWDVRDPAVPQAIRDLDAAQRSQGAEGDAEAVYHNGKVYVFARRANTPLAVTRVVAHEVLGHYGLRGAFDSRALGAILAEMLDVRREGIIAQAREYGLLDAAKLPAGMTAQSASDAQVWAAMSAQQRLQAAEEVLVHMAETQPDIGFVRRLVAAIRTWLRQHVPGFENIRVSDDEIIASFILPAAEWVRRWHGQPSYSPLTPEAAQITPMYSRRKWQKRAQSMQELADAARSKSNENRMVNLGNGKPEHWAQLREEGLQVDEGFSHTADMFAVRHAFKEHGNEAKEKARQQLPVTDADIRAAAQVVNEPDAWILGGVSKSHRNDEVASIKRMPDGTILYVEEVQTGRRALAMVSMRKYPGETDFETILKRFMPSNAQSDPRGIRIVYPRGKGSQTTGRDSSPIMFSRRGQDAPSTPEQRADALRYGGAGTASEQRMSFMESALAHAGRLFAHEGRVSLWDKTVGTPRHLAERVPAFRPVYEAALRSVEDVSWLANAAMDAAPRWMPRLESFRDLTRRAVAAADSKAVAAPLFEGTLAWARDVDGKVARLDDLQAKYARLSAHEKGRLLLRHGLLDPNVLRAWEGMREQVHDKAVNTRFEQQVLRAGVVFSAAELREHFGLRDEQIGLYREARAAIDRSLEMTARADMLRLVAGEWGEQEFERLRQEVLDAPTLSAAREAVTSALDAAAQQAPARAQVLAALREDVTNRAADVVQLQDRGYAPLTRFGRYTLDVVNKETGERLYFGMYESRRQSNLARIALAQEFPEGEITQGTLSQREFEMFQGLTPETAQLFGQMLGLETAGDEQRDAAFQEYLRRAKNNHSALKRLIHRKGIAGYSEDVGRVLASFIYSNARAGSQAMNAGKLEHAIAAIPKSQGELKDVAVGLREYLNNPREGGQIVRGFLFAQYLGGSVASALVNATQPFQVTMPWLSQFGGMAKAARQMARALTETPDAQLAAALKAAEADGTVSPQEVHQLMAQAAGRGSLISGDGTRLGAARAMANNAWERTKVAWGRPFSLAEQFNRRTTFIAAWRTAREQLGMTPDDAAAFARRAVQETQFVYCVDGETECLTTEGWKKRDALKVGDTVIGVDMLDGGAVETPLLAVHQFPGRHAVTQFSNATHFSMVVTGGHKNIVQNYSSKNKRWLPPMFRETVALRDGHHLMRVPQLPIARAEGGDEDFAALLGWIATEGYYARFRGCKEKRNVRLYQSSTCNPHYVEEIEALLQRLGGHYRKFHTHHNMVTFTLRKPLSERVLQAMPEKLLTWKMAQEMTVPEMRALMDAFAKGDGTKAAKDAWLISQKKVQNLHVLQAMSVMCGRNATMYPPGKGDGDIHHLYLHGHGLRTMVKQLDREETEVTDGVWCPETGAGTWIARRNGAVFVTGNSKGNKPVWARGTIGGALFAFKTYSVSYLELMHRMWTQGGKEGRRAVMWSVAMLLLVGGAGGLPFMEDAEDLIDGAGQLMGYNISTKHWRDEFLRRALGEELGSFMESGVSGLPGAPIDVAGRLGMGNLIPGTGLLLTKQDRSQDLKDIAGAAGDFISRAYGGIKTGIGGLATGDVGELKAARR